MVSYNMLLVILKYRVALVEVVPVDGVVQVLVVDILAAAAAELMQILVTLAAAVHIIMVQIHLTKEGYGKVMVNAL